VSTPVAERFKQVMFEKDATVFQMIMSNLMHYYNDLGTIGQPSKDILRIALCSKDCLKATLYSFRKFNQFDKAIGSMG